MNLISLIILFLFSFNTWADGTRFVDYFYDITSINKDISNAECQNLFSIPLMYTIENNKPIYKAAANFKPLDYQRLNTTLINDNERLFLTKTKIAFTLKGKKQEAIMLGTFVLNKSEHSIRGGWYLENFCQGSITGIEANVE